MSADWERRRHWLEAEPPRAEATVDVALIGEGPQGNAYASALARLRDIRLVATCGGFATCEGPRALLDVPSAGAVVIASGTNSFSLARRAILGGKHVLLCVPGALSPRQVRTLAVLAESRSRLLVFGEERLLSPHVGFLRKMLSVGEGLWLPRYLRCVSVRAAARDGSVGIASLAMEDLALCLYLLNRPALTVSAVACRPSRAAAFLNVTFGEGVVAGLQISLAEDWEARQLVVALTDRRLLLDEWDARAPLKVMSKGPALCREDSYRIQGMHHRAWAEWGARPATVSGAEPVEEQCRRFVEAVARRDLSKGNAGFWARVADLWEAAERSMAEDGAPIAVEPQTPGKNGARRSAPRLRLIRSGGIRRQRALPRPPLTLVGG